MKKAFRIEHWSVRQLHRYLEEGRFAVPRLQREFVWNGRKAATLLDSMVRSMPFGSLTIWDANPSALHLLRKNLCILPPYNPKNRRIWFLIDGQQRLSVIHEAFRGETRRNSREQEVDFSRVTFALDGGRTRDRASRFSYRRPVAGEHVSAPDMLAPTWRHRLKGHGTQKLARVEKARSALLDYRVPVLRLVTRDVDAVRELFVRINSLGTPIAAADRAFAQATEIDLRAMAREAWERFPPSFRRLPYEVVLQALALVEGVNDVGERAYGTVIRRSQQQMRQSSKAKGHFLRKWGRLAAALGKAIDYLGSGFHVLDESYLPSTYIVTLLALFFFHARGLPSARQKREIRKWYWATAVCQRYSGRGFRQNIASDAVFFKRLGRHGRARFGLSERADRNELLRTDYARRSSLADAFFCLLAAREPTYISNGDPVPQSLYVSRANKKNKHHIFPHALLRRNGIPLARAHSLCNICFVVAEENQSIGSKRPSVYLQPHRHRRHFAKSMRRALIPHKPDAGIWEHSVCRGFRRFLQQRCDLICKQFEREAGMRLFRKD